MKTRSLLSFLFLLQGTFFFGQAQALNGRDADGRRDGRWLIYLDKEWRKVEDSTRARYSRFTYFDHGTNIYPIGPSGGENYRMESASTATSRISLLDGEYKWYDPQGNLHSQHVFKNGEYISCKEYLPTGELHRVFDYTKKCKGQSHGWTMEVYSKKGKVVQKQKYCKDKKGNWPLIGG
jgi:antitoxin component YwqK of YwqJK toxin-antitoxin module